MTLLSFVPSHPVRNRRRPLKRNIFFSNNPLTNILETNDSYIVQLALPGKNKEDISIDLDNDILKISTTENTESTDPYLRKEFDYSEISKSFEVPDTVNQSAISAKMETGILYVTLPKKDEAQTLPPKTITIK